MLQLNSKTTTLSNSFTLAFNFIEIYYQYRKIPECAQYSRDKLINLTLILNNFNHIAEIW
jgi:hypothetical protein